MDKVWQEGSKDTNIVTTKEYAPQVQDALHNMIPECVHRFGIGTKGWFTREGLLAFQGVKWDSAKNKSVSDRDVEALRVVSEDYFGMGEAWRKRTGVVKRPAMSTQPAGQSNTTPTGPSDTIGNTARGKTKTTVDTLLAAIADKRNDAPSFGDLYQRPHDGDTIKTSKNAGNDDASLSSHESEGVRNDVTFADIPTTLPTRATTPGEGDISTAKSSTHYRLQRDKSRELAEKSQEESRQLLEILRLEREELTKTRSELERLKVSATTVNTIPPSANRGRIGPAADGVDEDK